MEWAWAALRRRSRAPAADGGLIRPLAVIVLLYALGALAQPAPERHLLSGADHFRAGRFEAALVEFKVADRLGVVQARWYVAAALTKTGRHDEAVETFLSAAEVDPQGRDAVLTWHEAVASYELRLYTRADALLAGLVTASPKIREQVEQLRAKMAPVLTAVPPGESVDAYLAQAGRARAAGRAGLARLIAEEARALARRRSDCYRCEDAERAVTGAPPRPAGGTPR